MSVDKSAASPVLLKHTWIPEDRKIDQVRLAGLFLEPREKPDGSYLN